MDINEDNSENEQEYDIASKIIENINQHELIKRDLGSLNRIIKIYFSKKRNKKEEKQVINFLFKCIDTFGKEYSILFTHLSKCSQREEIIEQLHEKYRDKFDFNVVNHELFDNSYKITKLKKRNKYLIMITLIFSFILYFSINKLFENHRNKNILVEEIQYFKQKLDEELNNKQKLEIELETKNVFDKKLSNFKENIEDEMKSKEQLGIEMKNNEILKDELKITKDQLENETKLRKSLEKELLKTKDRLENETRAKIRLENEILIINDKFINETKSRQTLEKELLVINDKIINNSKSKQNLENELLTINDKLINETKLKKELENELVIINDQLKNETKIKQNYENELIMIKNQLKNETETKQTLENELSMIKDQLDNKGKNKQSVEDELLMIKDKLKNETLSKQTLENELSMIKDQLENKTTSKQTFEDKISIINDKLKNETLSKQTLEKELLLIKSQLKNETESKQTLENELFLIKDQLENEIKSKENLEDELSVLNDQFKDETKSKQTIENELYEIKNQLEKKPSLIYGIDLILLIFILLSFRIYSDRINFSKHEIILYIFIIQICMSFVEQFDNSISYLLNMALFAVVSIIYLEFSDFGEYIMFVKLGISYFILATNIKFFMFNSFELNNIFAIILVIVFTIETIFTIYNIDKYSGPNLNYYINLLFYLLATNINHSSALITILLFILISFEIFYLFIHGGGVFRSKPLNIFSCILVFISSFSLFFFYFLNEPETKYFKAISILFVIANIIIFSILMTKKDINAFILLILEIALLTMCMLKYISIIIISTFLLIYIIANNYYLFKKNKNSLLDHRNINFYLVSDAITLVLYILVQYKIYIS